MFRKLNEKHWLSLRMNKSERTEDLTLIIVEHLMRVIN